MEFCFCQTPVHSTAYANLQQRHSGLRIALLTEQDIILHIHKQNVLKFLPVVSLDDTSPNGDGSIRKYFCGDDTGDIIGAHLLLLGEVGFINGSKSKLLFRVAPQAITPNCLQKF